MSLKELFVWLTAAAVFCWCVAQAGVENGYFWTATAIGGGMTLLWWLLARQRGIRGLAMLAPLPCIFLCLIAFPSLAILMLVPTLAIAGLACLLIGMWRGQALSSKTLAYIGVSCFLSAWIWGSYVGQQTAREFEIVRTQYPVTTLAPRLSYESKHTGAAPAEDRIASGGVVDERLKHVEDYVDNVANDYYGRTWTLQAIHERSYDNFVRAAGFGIERVMAAPPRRENVEAPDLRDLAFAATTSSDPIWGWRYRGYQRAPHGDSREQVFHNAQLAKFLEPWSFGWVQANPPRAAGFVPHAFYEPARDPHSEGRWRIERLELVSLLKFDRPRVYVLDHLPRMDQLSGDDVPTRELDAFERSALSQLRTQEDVVVEQVGEQTRMLGSLRAGRQCLDCHSVQRGELLGAFSYVLSGGATGEEQEGSEAAGAE